MAHSQLLVVADLGRLIEAVEQVCGCEDEFSDNVILRRRPHKTHQHLRNLATQKVGKVLESLQAEAGLDPTTPGL